MIKIRLLLIENNGLLRNGILEILKANKDIIIISMDLGLRSQNSSLHIVEIIKRETKGNYREYFPYKQLNSPHSRPELKKGQHK